MNQSLLNTVFAPFALSNSRSRLIWVSLFFLLYLAVGLFVYQDYGVSWDEPTNRNTGMVSLKYLGEHFAPDYISQDETFDPYPPLAEYYDKDYGVAFELPLSLLERIRGLDDSRDIYLFRHLVTFLVYFAGVFAFFQLAERRFKNWGLGLLGSLMLILSPRLFAESFYNDKDAVFMALFVICLNTAVRFLQYPTIRTACWYALTTAIVIDTRLMGIIFPAATLVMIFLKLERNEPVAKEKLQLSFLIYLVLSVLLVCAFWPYLWSSPAANFAQAFVNMASFRWDGTVLYFGEWVLATELPWHYIPVWLLITTPLPYVFLFVLGATGIFRKLLSRRLSFGFEESEWQDLLFLGLFVSPILAIIVMSSVVYDGWRQMYFIYPAFVLVALRGLVMLLHWRPRQYSNIWLGTVSSGALISLMYISIWMAKAHPYQNVYFNMVAGRDIKTSFEMDYWGLSSRQALQHIAKYDRRPSIAVWAGSALPLITGTLLLEPADRERLHIVDKEEIADYVITQYRLNLTDYGAGSRKYKPFYEINVGHAQIISVFKR